MDNPFNEEKKRPTFLSVLCILTFIGSGYNFLTGLISIFTVKSGASSKFMSIFYENMNKEMGDVSETAMEYINSGMQYFEKIVEYGVQIGIINTILYGLSILGAIWMYNLNKRGFYLYTAAQVGLLLVLPIFTGLNFVTVLSVFFSGIFTLAFIIMYRVNVKYMK